MQPRPDLPALVLAARPDLETLVSDGLPADQPEARLWVWLIAHGARAFSALREDEVCRRQLQGLHSGGLNLLQYLTWQARPDVQKAYPLPSAMQEFLGWFQRHGVQELGLWPLLSQEEQAALLWQDPEVIAALRPQALAWAAHQADLARPVPPAPFGVNVLGYAFGQLGIGEDARMASRALLGAGVPTCMLNFPPGHEVPQQDRSMQAHVVSAPQYAFNLVCLTAGEHARYFLEQGCRALRGRYNIGYWPWELSRWPATWQASLALVDEVWVSSEHTRRALQGAMRGASRRVPIRLMPLAVDVSERATLPRSRARKRFGLPVRACLFCFAYDPNSSVHRKNPQAVLAAFDRAFPAGSPMGNQVGLVIKTHRPEHPDPIWAQLKARAEADPRLHLFEQTLPRSDLLALYAACDCMVSLHRAEGFGRNIAEALQLGLHVVTTRYSGNLDYCEAAELRDRVDLVPAYLTPVNEGQYPYFAGQVWAEPGIGHAAWFMRSLASRRAMGWRHAALPAQGWPRFGLSEVGARYRLRLQQVWRSGAVRRGVFFDEG